MYAVGLSPLVGLNVVKTHFSNHKIESGEFFLKGKKGNDFADGYFCPVCSMTTKLL